MAFLIEYYADNHYVVCQNELIFFCVQAEYMQRICPKELAEMKKEFGEDLYLSLKIFKTDIGLSEVWLQRGTDEPSTILQSMPQELILGCFRKNYHLFPSVPRRYLADKSPKGSSVKCFSLLNPYH